MTQNGQRQCQGQAQSKEPAVTADLAAQHGIRADEYDRLLARLGRTPTFTELGMVSAMWSEHCSYKSSRVHLGTLPTTGPRVIQGPGENAGVVDIGDGQAVVFKMESHNHPSFLEPYQGAATGVGGICRDVFTMGARPIALADCLRFGRPENPRTRYLLHGVVAGIAGYGNSFGVPTVAGDVKFDPSYDGNILVNVFCLGVADRSRIFLGRAEGVGNPVLYVGARTGRDGIHGATMASAEFEDEEGDDDDAAATAEDKGTDTDTAGVRRQSSASREASAARKDKRPAVQVGDPFLEKLLLEACLELMASDALVGIQDMGAAGLTSSAIEMAARAGSGIDLDLDHVPCREAGMNAYEIMLSESQERMLLVVERGREAEAMAVFDRWDLDAAVIGTVTDSGQVVVRHGGAIRADLPADFLAEGLAYDRPAERPDYLDTTATFTPPAAPGPASAGALGEALLALLGSPDIAQKDWIYRQYDHNVRHGTVVRPGVADAAVVRVLVPPDPGSDRPATAKAIAITAGCQARYVYLAPYEGTRLAVAEAYSNLVAVGAEPLAVTNCLNFGNPEKPAILWQLRESIRGLGDACRELGTPVVSGNVSLYNETGGKAIKPTPMVAMVGLLPDARAHLTMSFTGPGQDIAVIGDLAGALDGSEYLAHVTGQIAGLPSGFDADRHRPVFAAVLAMIRAGLLSSAHDVSEGGLAVAIAECAITAAEAIGATIDVPIDVPIDALSGGHARGDEVFFGEAPARFVVSYPPARGAEVERAARATGATFTRVGKTGGSELAFRTGNVAFTVDVARAREAYTRGFRALAS